MNIVGIPAASFGPARPRRYRELTDLLELVVPVRGSYPEGFGKEGEYDINPAENVFLFGVLTEALLAHRVYPELKENQSFVLAGFDLHEDKVTVVGRIVEEAAE